MMRLFYATFVPGWPKTKGSVEAIPRRGGKGTYVRQSVQGSTEWARLVEDHVKRTFGGTGRPKRTGVGVRVVLTYWLPCYPDQLILKGARGNGDIDKLERNVLDALTRGGAYGDDAQVVGVTQTKESAFAAKRPAGVSIELYEDVQTRGWPVDAVIVDDPAGMALDGG